MVRSVAGAISAAILLWGTSAYALEQVQFAVPDAPGQSLSGDIGWDVPPNPNATGNLIFNSMSSLMQLWPNTVWRHGVYW